MTAPVERIEPGPDFDALFTGFRHSAFRLETREGYASGLEAEALHQFVTGEEVDLGWFRDWLALVGAAARSGRQFSRVRMVSLPLSDYNRFGLFCARHGGEAGEDIRYLAREQGTDLPDCDYWLFDDQRVVRMQFDDDGSFLGGDHITDPAEVVNYIHWRDIAWSRAVRRDDFAAEKSIGEPRRP